MRVCADHRKGTHVIADVVSAVLRHLLGFSQWAAHLNDGSPMLLDPGVPGCHAFSFPRTALARGERVPRHAARSRRDAEEYGQISIACAHDGLLTFCM